MTLTIRTDGLDPARWPRVGVGFLLLDHIISALFSLCSPHRHCHLFNARQGLN